MDKKEERLLQLIESAEDEYLDKNLILPIPGSFAKKFITYCAMQAEFQLILSYIIELRKTTNNVVKSALSYSLIALYGKCFTDASKCKLPKLEPSMLFNEGDKFYLLHDKLMDLRHNFIAHRGQTENELGIAYALVPRGGSKDKTEVRFSQLKMNGFSGKDLDDFENLMNHINSHLVKLIQKAGEKVLDSMWKQFTPNQLAIITINKKSTR